MIPFGNETVTLIKRSETVDAVTGRRTAVYTAHKLTGCSWRRSRSAYAGQQTDAFSESVTVRVPKEAAVVPSAGDLMIYGTYTGTVTGRDDFLKIIEAMKDAKGAFIVQSVSDNTLMASPLPHYKVTGGV